MKKLITILSFSILSGIVTPSLASINNSSNDNELHINVNKSNFMIGSSLENYYSEEFNLTALTGIHGWGEFTSKYHYFAWDGADWQRNNWYFGAIVLQCQRDGVRNSTLKLDTLPNARGIPINNSTHIETRYYYYVVTWSEVPSYCKHQSTDSLYYGGYYFVDSYSGDLWFGVSVNAQETGDTTAKFTFDVGTYASFWA